MPRSRDPRLGLIQEETPQARASLLAAEDEGVHRRDRGGRAPQFLRRHGGRKSPIAVWDVNAISGSPGHRACCGSQTRAPGQGQGRIAQRKKPGKPVGRRGLQTSIGRDFHVAANEPQKLVPVGESRPPSPRPSPPGEGASSSVSRQGLRVGNANDLRIANARQRSVRWHFSYHG